MAWPRFKVLGPRDLNRGLAKRGRTLSVTVLRNGSNNVSMFLFYSRAIPRHLTRTDKCCAVATWTRHRGAVRGAEAHGAAGLNILYTSIIQYSSV